MNEIVRLLRSSTVPWNVAPEDRVSSAVWRYPPGTGLGWHNDFGGGRLGEFVFFLHPDWDADWGGELVLIDQPAQDLSLKRSDEGPESILDFVRAGDGLAHVIMPMPNRVVFTKAGTAHMIKRVETAWTGEERLTHTGFVASQRTVMEQRAARLRSLTV